MLEEVSRYGIATIRRAYGDWTQPNLANWRPVMLAHAIQPIQQWSYTTGKNATDSALIIDAMDILYSGTVQGFCIVSSDSDYTRLCTRIRESGLFVMGMGEKKTPESFVKACNLFVHIENLIQADDVKTPASVTEADDVKPNTTVKASAKAQATAGAKSADKAKPKPSQKNLLKLLRRAFDIAVQDDDGWVHLGALGNALQRIEPSFDSRTYEFKSLSQLIKSMSKQIEVKDDKTTGTSTIYVRLKDNGP
jgi:hypothetical protein